MSAIMSICAACGKPFSLSSPKPTHADPCVNWGFTILDPTTNVTISTHSGNCHIYFEPKPNTFVVRTR